MSELNNFNYGFGRVVEMSFEQAIERVTEALQSEGFGVLSDIDVAGTIKKKLGEEMPPYRILGACNPALAHQAIQHEPAIGVLLPCNVIVREGEDGTVTVEAMNPAAVMDLVDNPAVAEVGGEVRQRLERVLAAIHAVD